MTTFNSTEQPVIWFRDRYLAGELILKPPFQRQPVWTSKQKSHLIESILLALPIPEIYIQHSVEMIDGAEKSVYAIVDGQQRIRTVLQFIGVDKTESEQEFNKFSLDNLSGESKFKDMVYSDLGETHRPLFLKYKFAVRMLETDDDETVRNIFRRLNRYVTKLNEQELRNATYTGPFMQLALAMAENEFWSDNRLVSPSQIRRMKDVEFVSELLIGVIHGPQGGSGKAIDEYYTQYEDYDDEFPNQKTTVKRFNATLDVIKQLFDGAEFDRFRTNRTDFYSLFVALTNLLIDHALPQHEAPKLRKSLLRFEREVDARLADEQRTASKEVIVYVRAVEKGANDKKRRADRHTVLLKTISAHFKGKKKLVIRQR